MQYPKKFNTTYKYVTILNIKYLIINDKTVENISNGVQTRIYQFNWDNISNMTYSMV